MEKKTKKEYNREYQRKAKGYITRQDKTDITKTGERLTIIIPKEHKEQLKMIAFSQEKGMNQLMREVIKDFVDNYLL